MEGDSAEIQAEVNDIELKNKQDNLDSAKGGESRTRKKRKHSELPSPTSDRPTRERKSIERLIISPEKEVKEFKIPKGTGTAFKDIPNIVFKLSKRRGSDEAVQALHKVLFGKTSKHAAKANILKFSGFSWSGNEDKEKVKVKDRLERLVKETLLQISDLVDLNISKGSKKEEAVLKVFEFLESPHKTTDKLVEERGKLKRGKKSQKKAAKGAQRGRGPGKSPKGKKKTPRKEATSDEDDEGDVADSEDAVEETEEVEDEPEDAEEEPEEKSDDDYNDKKKSPRKTKKKRKSTKEQSMQESEDEEEESSPKKRRKVQKEKTESSQKAKKEKKPRSKAAKVKEPSDDDLKVAICELLQNADFSKVTFTDVMKQLGDKFKVDLTHRKSHLKALIQDEIARLVGEGNEDEDSNNTEGGDGEEEPSGDHKDEDSNKDEVGSEQKEEDSEQKDEDSEQKDHADVSKESSKEENEDGDGDGDVEDSHGDAEDGKGEKAGDEDEDEDMNSGDDKADGAGEEDIGMGDDADAKREADEEAEGASTDMA